MEVTISADMLIELAALLTALGVIGGVALWCHRFVLPNRPLSAMGCLPASRVLRRKGATAL